MATSAIQEIINTQLTNASAALYTAPTGLWVQIVSLTCQNIDVATHNVTFHIVPSGSSSATSNIITNAQAITAGMSWNDPFVLGKVLNPGDALYGLADTGAVVNVFASARLAAAT